MSWIRLDDNCLRHRKVSGLSNRAFRWWIRSLCYAGEFLTDGLLPDTFLRTIPTKARIELLASGLLDVSDDVWLHDYLDYQSSREKVELERERGRRRRAGSGGRPVDDRGTSGGRPVDDRGTSAGNPRPPVPAPAPAPAPTPPETETTPKNGVVRGSGGGLVVSPLEFEKLSRFNAYVGARLRVPHKLHRDFVAALGGEQPDSVLMGWYAEIDAEIETSREAILPDVWKWLEARFKAWAPNRAYDTAMAAWVKEGT